MKASETLSPLRDLLREQPPEVLDKVGAIISNVLLEMGRRIEALCAGGVVLRIEIFGPNARPRGYWDYRVVVFESGYRKAVWAKLEDGKITFGQTPLSLPPDFT